MLAVTPSMSRENIRYTCSGVQNENDPAAVSTTAFTISHMEQSTPETLEGGRVNGPSQQDTLNYEDSESKHSGREQNTNIEPMGHLQCI